MSMVWLGMGRLACADFGVDRDGETFEGSVFPASGWRTDVVNDYGSTYGEWDKAVASGYVSGGEGGFSGYAAGSIYGDHLLETSLITPEFSTVGYGGVRLDFSGYFYFYPGYGNQCDLQYSTDGGTTWITLKTWDTYGTPVRESIALPDEALGQTHVTIRWQRYTTSYPCYYALVDNVFLHSAWDADYQALGGGWRRLSWFGDYAPMGNEWIWHNGHGFLYVYPFSSPQSVYIFAMDMEWLWTNEATYPYVYRFSDGAWLWCQTGPDNSRRFLNCSTGAWEEF